MELKPGYKLTEIGVIPEDWDLKPLKKISPQQSVGLVINPSTYFDTKGTVPMLVGSNVNENKIDWISAKKITEDSNQKLPASKLSGGDLVMVRVGEPGTTAVIPPEFDGCNCASMMIIRKHPTFDSDWLCFAMNSHIGRSQVLGVQYGTAQKQFNISDAIDFRYPVPSLPEQRSIATALSDMDELLGGLDRLITKKRDLKQSAMQQLLTGKTRLPGFDGEWKETTLGEIGECIIGLTYKPENVVEHGLLVLRSSNVQNGQLTYDNNVYVNLKVSDHLVTRMGDILICVRNGSRSLIGKCTVIDSNATGLTFGAFMSVYRTNYWCFIAHAFQSHDIQRQIRDNIGATINQITNKDMKAFCVMLPPEDEQIAIAQILSDMDTEIATLEQRRNKTRDLKQAMMQELLTGRIRLL
jgi:type I restriction enzyme, S subunit